jgi:hypothetical protein
LPRISVEQTHERVCRHSIDSTHYRILVRRQRSPRYVRSRFDVACGLEDVDIDGDGETNEDEATAGTDPRDAHSSQRIRASLLTIIRLIIND